MMSIQVIPLIIINRLFITEGGILYAAEKGVSVLVLYRISGPVWGGMPE